MSMLKSYAVLAFLLLSFLFAGGCKNGDYKAQEAKRPEISGVTVLKVEPSQTEIFYETTGTVKALNSSVIASRVIGTVLSMNVSAGDSVRAGQVLLTIDDSDAIQRVKAAEKGYEAAKQRKGLSEATFNRYKKLFDQKAISQQEMDQIETQKKVDESELERAKALFAEAQTHQGFTKITAPLSGVVVEKKIDRGSTAVPGTPIITIEENSGYRFEAAVDERLLGSVKRGMAVYIVIDAIGQTVKGVINEVVPAVDPASRSFLVKVGINSTGLRSGLYGKLLIPEGKRNMLLVPQKAVIEKGQLTGVYAVDEKGVVTYRLIKAGKMNNGMTEILSGLNAGEKIIAEGAERAVDGGMVRQ
ncbi:MAG: efflux RND transporter periplasmic adaptor subunit [Nitrospirae bacterium]|nr:efflux RND transporter periplasmic adaptor subunit [Nitrospirota bacterium]